MAKSKDVVKQIRKANRRKFSADQKIRIVLEGLRGEVSISEICRREQIVEKRKQFLKGKELTLESLKQELKLSPKSKVNLSHFC